MGLLIGVYHLIANDGKIPIEWMLLIPVMPLSGFVWSLVMWHLFILPRTLELQKRIEANQRKSAP